MRSILRRWFYRESSWRSVSAFLIGGSFIQRLIFWCQTGRWRPRPEIKLSELKARRFSIIDRTPIVDCSTCGANRDTCMLRSLDFWNEFGVRCWHPMGTVLVWDERGEA